MGCFFCKEKKEPSEVFKAKQEYSWDKRIRADPKDYTISDLADEDVCRAPGTVNGQHFAIENCNNCSIFILDHLDSVNVDNCTNCRIVLGPIKGSVFLRECADSAFVIPCSQFRARDSHRCNVFLYCATQPIIESSTHMRFGCLRMYYNEFKAHLATAGLCIFNNMWRNIHDFTPVDGDQNWRVMPDNVRLQDYITPPFPTEVRSCGWSVSGEPSVIPITQGLPVIETNGRDICLVLILPDKELIQKAQQSVSQQLQEECAMAFLTTLFQDQTHRSQLLTARQVQLRCEDAVTIMPDTKQYATLLDLGPVIGLILAGEGCTSACKKVSGLPTLAGRTYVSRSAETTTNQVSSFIRSATVQLGC